ncbi:MAG: hypothetical protein H7Y33_05665 [Cytophagales bacterium]|nr:hypothetical protein [Rhizobacter sp.]
MDYARGYLTQYRPNVGRVVISAPLGSVELNGLNLDGNTNPADSTPGLQVTAGRRIVSNNEIAVNKGDIELTGGNTQATDGVYLGSSVYSRGHDSVGADGVRGGTDDQKTGYGIRITGRVLALYDNTREMAQLPVNTFTVSWYEAGPGSPPPIHQVRTDADGFVVDVAGLRQRNPDGSYQLVGTISSNADPVASDLNVFNVTAGKVIAPGYALAGQAVRSVQGLPSVVQLPDIPAGPHVPAVVLQEVAKIEVANNVANFQDPTNVGTLVAANTGLAASRVIQIGTGSVAGVANHTPQTAMRLTDPAPVLTELSQTPIVSAPTDPAVTAAQKGIGLKLLSFRETGDTSSFVWGTRVQLISPDSNSFFSRIDQAEPGQLLQTNLTASVPVDGIFTITLPALASRTFTSGGSTRTQIVELLAGSGTATHTFLIVPGTAGNNFRDTVQLTQVALNSINLSGLPPATTLPTSGATNVSAWTASAWRDPGATGTLRIISPTLVTNGSATGVSLASSLYPTTGAPVQSGAGLLPSFLQLNPDRRQVNPFEAPAPLNPLAGIPQAYQLSGVLSDSLSAAASPDRAGTRVFVYDGIIKVANGATITDSNTGVAIPGLGGIAGFNNSTVGFAGVGAGFGSLAGGTAGSTGAGAASGQGVGGALIPGAQSGSGALPTVEDRSAQDAGGSGPVNSASNGQPGAADVFFGARASAQADMGRGGAVPGSAVNVFKRSYKLATAQSGTVCAPDAVQQAPTEGAAARDCPAAK